MAEPVAQPRIVPGAPPPTAASRALRKKRKTKSKSDESPADATTPDATVSPTNEGAPDSEDPLQSTQAQQPAPQESQAPSVNGGDAPKHSPIVDLVTKRLKATTKKMNRITSYASTDGDKLDDDQKRSLKTLPVLEAIQKELIEVKKAVEVHENELAHQLAAQRVLAENTEKARVQEAVATAQSILLSRAGEPFNLLRTHSLIANNELDPSSLSLQEAETNAIFSAADILLGEDVDHKNTVIAGFLVEDEGSHHGVSYSRLIEITNLALNPPREPTPEPEPEPEGAAVTTDEIPSTASITGPSEHGGAVIGVPESIAASNSFHFMQDSELEGPFEDAPAEIPQQTVVASEAVAEADASVNGHAEALVVSTATDVPATIDWAADETAEELPSIAGLHAEFGTSGSAAPTEQSAHVNGDANATTTPGQPEDDGFTQTGRGSRGGYRGDFRGRGGRGHRGHRGGFRGGHGQSGHGQGGQGERDERGGDRGGFRGGNHYRPRGDDSGQGGHGQGGQGERDERGGDRGGFRGGNHYRPRGDDRGRGGYRGRGDYRGDGERRGGGRGRGRGDRGGPRPQGNPAAPAPAPAPAPTASNPVPTPNAAT